MVRCIDAAKGIATPRTFTPEEIKYREFQKKSIVAAGPLSMGSVLKANDLAFLRAETLGMSPSQIDAVVGKTLTQDIAAFETITEDSLS